MNREQRRHPNNVIQFPTGALAGLSPEKLAEAAAEAARSKGPPQLVVNGGPLMNDIQLVAMIAAGIDGSPSECVDQAQEIVALAVVRQEKLIRRIEELRKPA